MIRTVVFTPPAQAEVAAAFEWYEQRSYGLGGEFLRAVAVAEERLSRSADQYPAARFPYALHFEVLGSQDVSVLPCLHLRQSPRRWPDG